MIQIPLGQIASPRVSAGRGRLEKSATLVDDHADELFQLIAGGMSSADSSWLIDGCGPRFRPLHPALSARKYRVRSAPNVSFVAPP
jgi:hypothetical protein